jgi:hypothetical protein
MQNLELPLFTTSNFTPQSKEIVPIQPLRTSPNPHTSIENALNSIFPQKSEENKIIRTRKNLGETAKALSDEQIECINTEFQFLIDSWLDEYEKDVFNGMTLKQVLNEG